MRLQIEFPNLVGRRCPQRAASVINAAVNQTRSSVQTTLRNLIAFLFLTIATNYSAEPTQPASSPAAQPLRYLFLVEISSDMATLQVPSAQTIHDIILRSFEGEIKPGQLYSTWFYGSRVQTNPPIVWREGHEAAMARYTANLFSGRVFSRLPPRATLGEAAPFIAASPKLTIFLFTDGSHPIAGTPFDDKVNSALEKHYSAFQRAEKPFVITFFASKGKLIDANVPTKPTEPFRIPELDRQDETLAKALEAVRTAPQPKPAAAADLDKALAAVRNAQPPASQTDTEKARAALRDALEGKTNSAPAEKLAMQVAPALREPPKDEAEQPRPQPTPEKPKEIPSLLARPPETTQQVVPTSGGAVEPNPPPQSKVGPDEKPVTAKPVEGATQPKPAEKPPETKPTVTPPIETPKPVPTPPKTAAIEPKIAVAETKVPISTPKPVVTPQPALKETKIAAAEPKAALAEPTKIAMATPPSPAAEKKSEPNTAAAAKPSSPTQLPTQTAVVTPSSHFPWPALIGGLAVIAFGGAFAVIRAKRRAKSPGSIITQALPKNGPRFK